MPTEPEHHLTQILHAASSGDLLAAERLLPAVYDELRRMASHLMGLEKPGHTLQPTALVHEAYLKIAGTGNTPSFEDRRHFFNAAACAMRRVLIDRHRRVESDKRGGGARREEFNALEIPAATEFTEDDTRILDPLLDQLRAHNPRWSDVLHLRYFVGLSIEQTAEVLGIAESTVKSDWSFSRAWLRTRLKQAQG